jgi:hypothetical protein
MQTERMNENHEIRNLIDTTDSLHQRMDRFYEWASKLQVEMRNAHQRLWVLEAAAKDRGGLIEQDPTEESIMARLNALHSADKQ